ncbi:MAG: DUF29 family protein [Candidatus Binataceae bacterium]
MALTAKRAGQAKERGLYERDYYGWIQRNVRAIREDRLKDVDWANVAEGTGGYGEERAAGATQSIGTAPGTPAQVVPPTRTLAFQRT